MAEPTEHELQARYRAASDGQLAALAAEGAEQFTPVAWRLLQDETARRGTLTQPPAPGAETATRSKVDEILEQLLPSSAASPFTPPRPNPTDYLLRTRGAAWWRWLIRCVAVAAGADAARTGDWALFAMFVGLGAAAEIAFHLWSGR